MSEPEMPHQDLPTLTEVIAVGVDAPGAGPAVPSASAEVPPPPGSSSAVVLPMRVRRGPDPDERSVAVALEDELDESVLTERVLEEVQRHVDRMFEYRLREALTPLLARAVDHLVHEAREELAGTLHDIVRRAVAQALARERNR